MIALLLLDGTLDSRLAAIILGNGERDGNSSNNTVNQSLARLALHSYDKLRECLKKMHL